MKNVIAILIVFLFWVDANASITEGGRGMLFGEDYTFSVTAIKGWVLDNQSAVKQGLHMVFYPKGETWGKSQVIIYGRAVATTKMPSIKSQVEETISEFHNGDSPNYKSEEKTQLVLSEGKKANIYHSSGDKWGNYEAAAYIQEKDTINYLVFHSKTKELFDKHIADFYQIVKSYQNLYAPSSELTKEGLENLKKESSSFLSNKPEGKEYESKAMKVAGLKMRSSMRDCSFYISKESLPIFTYLVRINNQGDIMESFVHPTNALSVCFKGLMSDVAYPSHSFESFLLNIEVKVVP